METVLSIHPAIGIARVGNSDIKDANGNPDPESYFIGQETSGFGFEPEQANAAASRYRDSFKKLRRQGVRFRIYEKTIDPLGNVVSTREIDKTNAAIIWTVEVANKKASAKRFPPYFKDWKIANGQDVGDVRNHHEPDRSKLMVTPDSEDISLGQGTKELAGTFYGDPIKLADIFADNEGHLIFLGGHGKTYDPNSVGIREPGLRRHKIYNYDQICDDTSDGWITAKVTLNDGQVINVDGNEQRARIITAPPNFAPSVQSTITLYDVTYQANLIHRPDAAMPEEVLFTRDIYPFLYRVVCQQYVSKEARWGHGKNKKGDFMKESILKKLSSKTNANKQIRQRVVDLLTKPGASDDKIKMPKLYGGVNYNNPDEKPDKDAENDRTRMDSFGTPLVVTPYQRKILTLWATGRFKADWPGSPPIYGALDTLDIVDRPDALDRAGLEDCSGGSFHPGIEGPYLMARGDTYVGWFRIDPSFEPGDLTKGMAVPWHTDFGGCSQYWWPAQRPNEVPIGNNKYKNWARGWPTYDDVFELGIVSEKNGVIKERERNI